jgi:hypothetical protein
VELLIHEFLTFSLVELEKERWYTLDRRLGKPRSQYGSCVEVEEKNPAPPGIKPRAILLPFHVCNANRTTISDPPITSRYIVLV